MHAFIRLQPTGQQYTGQVAAVAFRQRAGPQNVFPVTRHDNQSTRLQTIQHVRHGSRHHEDMPHPAMLHVPCLEHIQRQRCDHVSHPWRDQFRLPGNTTDQGDFLHQRRQAVDIVATVSQRGMHSVCRSHLQTLHFRCAHLVENTTQNRHMTLFESTGDQPQVSGQPFRRFTRRRRHENHLGTQVSGKRCIHRTGIITGVVGRHALDELYVHIIGNSLLETDYPFHQTVLAIIVQQTVGFGQTDRIRMVEAKHLAGNADGAVFIAVFHRADGFHQPHPSTRAFQPVIDTQQHGCDACTA